MRANDLDASYGANVLDVMGKAAFVCAAQHARTAVVMAKADNIEFVHPIRMAPIIDVRAEVVFQGHSTMTVIVHVVTNLHGAGEATPTITGRFMMIAVGSDGTPAPIRFSNLCHAEESAS